MLLRFLWAVCVHAPWVCCGPSTFCGALTLWRFRAIITVRWETLLVSDGGVGLGWRLQPASSVRYSFRGKGYVPSQAVLVQLLGCVIVFVRMVRFWCAHTCLLAPVTLLALTVLHYCVCVFQKPLLMVAAWHPVPDPFAVMSQPLSCLQYIQTQSKKCASKKSRPGGDDSFRSFHSR